MSSNTVWVKTHKALNSFIQVLTCNKCHKSLSNPLQFLNCGHFACTACVGSETDCIQCNIPGEVSDIISDNTVNDLLQHLTVIAGVVGFSKDSNSTNSDIKSPSTPLVYKNNKNILKKQINKKITKPKIIDKSLNSSTSESTISRASHIKKTNDKIPKNINKKNNKGETALHCACRSGDVNRVKILLEAGADPNTKDNAGWTPLQEAVSYGYFDVSEALLLSGANANMYGYDNRTALHEAVIIDDCDIVSLLFNFNANKKVYDNVGKRPRDYCKSKKMTNLFKKLQEKADNESETTKESHNKTSNLDRSINQTITESKIVLYGSNLKSNSRKLLSALAARAKLKIANTLSPQVSHVIIDTQTNIQMIITFDLLLAILYGKWLISSDCLSVLKESDNITSNDLILFEVNPPQLNDGPLLARENEIKQNPKLFNNCHFYFAVKSYEKIRYDNMLMTKDDLTKLVNAGDGITLTREPNPEDIQGSLSPFHVAHDPKHSLHKCTHYIIYVPDDSSKTNINRIMYNMPTLKTLPLMWFIESILTFQLIDPIELGLLTK